MKNKRRLIEWGKNLLILLLSLSALYLLTMTPIIQDSGILELIDPGQGGGGNSAAVTLAAADKPAAMVLGSGELRYGVQYDQDGVDELFARTGPLLGEALVSAQAPKSISETRWQRCLQGGGIYFDFSGDVPLQVLSRWLQSEGQSSLTAASSRVLLAAGQDDAVFLCYQDAADGAFYACATGLSWSLHLEPIVGSITDNGVLFAFESDDWARNLDPYNLITEETARPAYTVSTPVSPIGDLSKLLVALDYTGRNHASTGNGVFYLDGNDRLEILYGGQVSFDAAQGGKYPVATAGEEMTQAEAIETARGMAESTVGAQCGEAELYLMSVYPVEGGYQIRFGYRLNGSEVWLYDEGWAAEFYVIDGYVSRFTLYFRSYVSSGEQTLLLPMERAAAMLPVLTGQEAELLIQYRDQGEATVEPAWTAR